METFCLLAFIPCIILAIWFLVEVRKFIAVNKRLKVAKRSWDRLQKQRSADLGDEYSSRRRSKSSDEYDYRRRRMSRSEGFVESIPPTRSRPPPPPPPPTDEVDYYDSYDSYDYGRSDPEYDEEPMRPRPRKKGRRKSRKHISKKRSKADFSNDNDLYAEDISTSKSKSGDEDDEIDWD